MAEIRWVGCEWITLYTYCGATIFGARAARTSSPFPVPGTSLRARSAPPVESRCSTLSDVIVIACARNYNSTFVLLFFRCFIRRRRLCNAHDHAAVRTYHHEHRRLRRARRMYTIAAKYCCCSLPPRPTIRLRTVPSFVVRTPSIAHAVSASHAAHAELVWVPMRIDALFRRHRCKQHQPRTTERHPSTATTTTTAA